MLELHAHICALGQASWSKTLSLNYHVHNMICSRSCVPVSCVVEVVNSVNANGQSVEENPTTNQVEQVVTHILVHRNPVQERERERERER